MLLSVPKDVHQAFSLDKQLSNVIKNLAVVERLPTFALNSLDTTICSSKAIPSTYIWCIEFVAMPQFINSPLKSLF